MGYNSVAEIIGLSSFV